ncbi:unnamed protein product [Closterium sp. Yama58-4]|nr:unnamed protein product [Closterium sp. Yama58-4]
MEFELQATRGDSLRNDPSYSSSDDDSTNETTDNGGSGNLSRIEGGQRAGAGSGDGPGARDRECKGGRIPRGSQGSQSPQAAVTAAGAESVSRSANVAAPPLPRLDAMGSAANRHVRVVEDAALWYACAGPLVTVPAVGSLVVYFPQGHVEQQQRLAQRDPPQSTESESPPRSPPSGLSSPIAISTSESQSQSHNSGDDSPSPSHGGNSGLSQSPSQSDSSGCTLPRGCASASPPSAGQCAQSSGSPGGRGGSGGGSGTRGADSGSAAESAQAKRRQQLPPSHIFCRLTAVALQADERTHELMVRFDLQPVDEAEAVRVQAAASQEARRAGAGGRRRGRNGEKADAQEERSEEGGMDADGGRTQAARSGGLQAQAGVQAGVHTHMGAHARLHMCCKRLSTSDAAPHGGFFIPRKAAESLFPALDANEEGPCQQLVASDVFGREWNFRHVYRGSPRRHLLTAGWSALCASWGLAASDRIIFLRAGNGALKVGARRSEAVLAAQHRRQRERERGRGASDGASSAGAAKDSSNTGAHAIAAAATSRGGGGSAATAAVASVTASQVLEWAAHCHGVKRAFSVVYHPWYPPLLSSLLPTPALFPSPCSPSSACLDSLASLPCPPLPVSSTRPYSPRPPRFVRISLRLTAASEVRMAFETDELSTHRLRGTVTAVHRAASGVWPTSQWRSVRVRWFDCDPSLPRPPLVSPWHLDDSLPSAPRASPCSSSLSAPMSLSLSTTSSLTASAPFPSSSSSPSPRPLVSPRPPSSPRDPRPARSSLRDSAFPPLSASPPLHTSPSALMPPPPSPTTPRSASSAPHLPSAPTPPTPLRLPPSASPCPSPGGGRRISLAEWRQWRALVRQSPADHPLPLPLHLPASGAGRGGESGREATRQTGADGGEGGREEEWEAEDLECGGRQRGGGGERPVSALPATSAEVAAGAGAASEESATYPFPTPLRPLPTAPSHAAPPYGDPRPARLSLASLLPLTDCHVAADSAEERPGKKPRSADRCASWQSGDLEGREEEGDEACEEQEMRDEECGKGGEEGDMVEAQGREEEERREGEMGGDGEEGREKRKEGEKAEQGAEEGVTGRHSHSSCHAAAAAAGQSRRIKLRVEGSPVMRTVDLSGIGSFQSLYATCAAMLQLPLQQPGEPSAGATCPWQLTYTDTDGDTLLVGDGPWSEFVRDARKLSVIRTPKLQQWGESC